MAFISQISLAQVSGNINYQSRIEFPDHTIDLNTPATKDIFISVKGLANLKADSYLAIFSLTQVGKTAEEVNELIDARLSQAISKI